MAWAAHKVSLSDLLRNWSVIYVANFVGALVTAWVVWRSGLLGLAAGGVGQTLTTVVQGKTSLGWEAAFWRGLLCNALVCLAIWMCFAAHTVTDKILAIIFPIAGFVALGLEHSVANMFFLPLAWLYGVAGVDAISIMANLIPVTLGNIAGGGAGVALTYWLIWLRPQDQG
jgi:formate/nitrite transporter